MLSYNKLKAEEARLETALIERQTAMLKLAQEIEVAGKKRKELGLTTGSELAHSIELANKLLAGFEEADE